jgi:hypothetical protein
MTQIHVTGSRRFRARCYSVNSTRYDCMHKHLLAWSWSMGQCRQVVTARVQLQ